MLKFLEINKVHDIDDLFEAICLNILKQSPNEVKNSVKKTTPGSFKSIDVTPGDVMAVILDHNIKWKLRVEYDDDKVIVMPKEVVPPKDEGLKRDAVIDAMEEQRSQLHVEAVVTKKNESDDSIPDF